MEAAATRVESGRPLDGFRKGRYGGVWDREKDKGRHQDLGPGKPLTEMETPVGGAGLGQGGSREVYVGCANSL